MKQKNLAEGVKHSKERRIVREMNEQCKESTKEEGEAGWGGGGTAISMSQRNKLKDNKRETGWVSKPPTARTSSFRFRGMMMGSPLGEVGWGNIGYSEEDHQPQFRPQIKAEDFILCPFLCI